MAGKNLPKMKNSVKKSNANTNSNNISKFQKAALLPTQVKAVKGGEGTAIIIEDILIA